MEKPDEGKRVRCRYRGCPIYICPFVDSNGRLVAIDLSQSTGDDNHLTMAGLRFVSELIGSLLKHEDGVSDISAAASMSSLSGSDLPGIISEIVKTLVIDTPAVTGATCKQ